MHIQATVERVANRFVELLRREIGVDDMNKVRHLSKSSGEACPSHDFLDANEVMAEAFEAVMHREIDLQNAEDCDLWNEAWTQARRNNYRETQGGSRRYASRIVQDGKTSGEFVDWAPADAGFERVARENMAAQGYKVKSITIGEVSLIVLED